MPDARPAPRPHPSLDRVRPVAPGDVVVHVGPPKTGSTTIQRTMAARREELRALGVLYPGQEARARFAGFAVMGVQRRGLRAPRRSEWDDLVREVDESGLRSVVSSEALARADDDAVARIVESFGAERVHVVAVGRRLDRTLPSLYQETVKKFEHRTYEEWLAEILPADDPETLLASFRHGQMLSGIAARWLRFVAPERFHVICAADGDRALMPRAFERLLDLPEGFLEPRGDENTSLDRAGVELLRRLNEVRAERGWNADFHRTVTTRGVVNGLRRHGSSPDAERVPRPPGWALRRIATVSEHTVAGLREQGVDVVGDLEALRPDPGSGAAGTAGDTAAADVTDVPIDVAVAALAGVAEASVRAWRRERKRARRAARRAAGAGRPEPAAGGPARRLSRAWARLSDRRGPRRKASGTA